jgi:peptide/nickel transport system permease protein
MDLLEQIPATLEPARLDTVTDAVVGRSRVWHILRRNPMFWLGAIIVAIVFAGAILAPVIATHDPVEQFRDAVNAKGDPSGPSAEFPLGVDVVGRDYLSRLLYGARTSLLIGIGANLIATVLGLLVGSVAALVRSPRVPMPGGHSVGLPLESVLMRATDLWLAFPVLLLTIAIAGVVGPSVELVIFIIATTLWTATARIVYTRMVILRTSGFVEASAALGGSGRHVFLRHHLPNVTPLLVVYASLGIAATVLFEATLSYLGVGVPPPTPTWGTMLADNLSRFITDPRLVMIPGLAITVTVLAFNLLGDSLRDAMDPRSWGAR